jgi:Leucine rich repeat
MDMRFGQLLRSLACRGNSFDYRRLQKLNDLNFDDPVIVGKVITAFCDAFQFPQVHREILKQSLRLRQIAVRALLEDPSLHYCVPFVERLAQETDIDLKQEIFNYVEHRIDRYQPTTVRNMLMWYEFAQAFAAEGVLVTPSVNLHNLTELYVGSNPLEDSSETIDKLESLTHLDIGNNRSASIPTKNSKLKNLTDLTISNSDIITVADAIDKLPSLTHLTSYIWICDLPPEIGKLTNLTYLNLSNTHISNIPPEIGELKQLTYLNLSQNRIKKIPPEIGGLKNLTKLILDDNFITDIPTEIGELKYLTELNLENNKITEIPQFISSIEHLQFQCSYRSFDPTC